jgi:hypothetical protein
MEKAMLTDQEIEEAKARTKYRLDSERPLHEHNDCIRIAYEWLRAQKRTINPPRKNRFALKHMIENWGGRYVSQNDVEVAATLLGLEGEYPSYNFSRRLVWPSERRLGGIAEAKTQHYEQLHKKISYAIFEP